MENLFIWQALSILPIFFNQSVLYRVTISVSIMFSVSGWLCEVVGCGKKGAVREFIKISNVQEEAEQVYLIAGLLRARSARGTEPHTHGIWSTSFCLVVT